MNYIIDCRCIDIMVIIAMPPGGIHPSLKMWVVDSVDKDRI